MLTPVQWEFPTKKSLTEHSKAEYPCGTNIFANYFFVNAGTPIVQKKYGATLSLIIEGFCTIYPLIFRAK